LFDDDAKHIKQRMVVVALTALPSSRSEGSKSAVFSTIPCL